MKKHPLLENYERFFGRISESINEADSDIPDVKNMSFTGIVDLIYKDWKKVNYGAKPYLEAMATMSNVTDKYMFDSGPSIIRYFLANATSWKGEVAKAVKAELNRRIKGKY